MKLNQPRTGMLEIVAAATVAGLVSEVIPDLAEDSTIKYLTAAFVGTVIGTVAGKALADRVKEIHSKKNKALNISKVAIAVGA